MKRLSKKEWLELNGFSQYEVTYLVLGNSYSIKDELKENGFKFSPLLRWHSDNCDFQLPDNCKYYELHYDELFVWDENTQTTFLKEGARDRIELIFNPISETNSEYVGEIGERLHKIPMKIRNIGGFDSAYGYKWVYTFEDENGNVYSWFTPSQQAVTIGMECHVSGTIKAHVEYKRVPTTQLSRCNIYTN